MFRTAPFSRVIPFVVWIPKPLLPIAPAALSWPVPFSSARSSKCVIFLSWTWWESLKVIVVTVPDLATKEPWWIWLPAWRTKAPWFKKVCPFPDIPPLIVVMMLGAESVPKFNTAEFSISNKFPSLVLPSKILVPERLTTPSFSLTKAAELVEWLFRKVLFPTNVMLPPELRIAPPSLPSKILFCPKRRTVPLSLWIAPLSPEETLPLKSFTSPAKSTLPWRLYNAPPDSASFASKVVLPVIVNSALL